MSMAPKKTDKRSWILGGGILVGVGGGLILLAGARFLFVGSLISGLGAGIIVASVMTNKK